MRQLLIGLKRLLKFGLSSIRRRLGIGSTSLFDHKDVSVCEIYEREEFRIGASKDVFENHNKYVSSYSCKVPNAYLAIIKQGIFAFGFEEVFSKNKECFVEITAQKRNPKIGVKPKNIRKISGTVANLSLSGLEDNYYHFNVEWMARFHLLGAYKEPIDYYVVPQNESFQFEYLELLGVSREKVLKEKRGHYIQCDLLLVPSLINNWKPISFYGHLSFQKQWLPSWFKLVHDCNLLPNRPLDYPKIFVSRANANSRKLVEEDKLKIILGKLGFQILNCENLTVKEQILAFRNAKMVMGIHGAGLTNICNCHPGTVLLEIFPSNYIDSSFRILSEAMNFNYEYMVGEPGQSYGHAKEQDVKIDFVTFENIIHKVLTKYSLA